MHFPVFPCLLHFFCHQGEDSFFNGRDFGDSIDTVRTVLNNVRQSGDSALHEYSEKFDVSAPASFLIPQEELKAAAEKMKKNEPEYW